jgi:uncharacterized protein (DUF169 family)
VNLKEINERLNIYIRPQTFPIAIRLYDASEKIPDKARIPKRDLGAAIPICQGIGLARRYGWTVAIGKEDQSCPHGLFVLGLIPGGSYLDGSSGEAAGVGNSKELAQLAKNVSRLEYGKYCHVVAAPLHNATFEPHVIMIYGVPAQIARLVQGVSAMTGKALNTPTFGGVACGSFIARTMLTDECQVILAGAGDRYFALTQDHELAFTIPWSKAETVLQGLEKGHKSGMHRYPTPSTFRFDGALPPVYYRWTEILRKEQERD